MILAILQARCSSTRLPNKVLKPVLGEPMIQRQIERVSRAKRFDQLVLATSVDPSDDPLAKLCAELGVPCFRGSLDDVLDRYYQAAKSYHPDYVVRLTGDCPLADPEVIDYVITRCIEVGADYASNGLPPTYPDGLDVEIFRFSVLERAWHEAQLRSEREHVSAYIYKHPELFKLEGVTAKTDLSHLRWTVDNPEDFEFVSRIYGALYPGKPSFSTADILSFLKNSPELTELNSHIARNEGYQKSLAAEQPEPSIGQQKDLNETYRS